MSPIPLGIIGASGAATPFIATGGNVIDSNGYRYHVFTVSDNFSITSAPKNKQIFGAFIWGGSGGVRSSGTNGFMSEGGPTKAQYYSFNLKGSKDVDVPVIIGAGGAYTGYTDGPDYDYWTWNPTYIGYDSSMSVANNASWLLNDASLLDEKISKGGKAVGSTVSGQSSSSLITNIAPENGQAHSNVLSWPSSSELASQLLLTTMDTSGGGGGAGYLRTRRYVYQNCAVYNYCWYTPDGGWNYYWGRHPMCGVAYYYDCGYYDYFSVTAAEVGAIPGGGRGYNLSSPNDGAANTGGGGGGAWMDATYFNNAWSWSPQTIAGSGGSGYAIIGYQLEET